MKYIDGFRDSRAADALRERIRVLAAGLEKRRDAVRIMEVCGTHTMAIARSGIRGILPGNVELISGPGCPVCVTDAGFIDAAIELAGRGAIIASFGDMLRVPGSRSSLSSCRAEGGTVEVCYSPLESLELAARDSGREVVFLGIGFETTIAPVVSLVEAALKRGLKNVSLLTAFKTVPPAMRLLAADPGVKLNAFLCPAHVSAIIGADAYIPIASRFNLPCVVAGFEPLDILLGIEGILGQLARGEARVENQYNRVVRPRGNPRALALFERFLETVDAPWRGLGVVAQSGLKLKPEFTGFDAALKFGIEVKAGRPSPKCRCGAVLKGILRPPQCELFDRECSPQRPLGPCMVSAEGACSAYYKYLRAAA